MTTHSFRTTVLQVALLFGAAALPAALQAQTNSGAPLADSIVSTTRVAGDAAATTTGVQTDATLGGPRVAPSALATSKWTNPLDAAPLPQDDNVNIGPNLALMGVGAAAVVVGLLVGGDGGTAIALGGGVIGLIGLYRYLR